MSYDLIIKRLEHLRATSSGDNQKIKMAMIRIGSVLQAEAKLNIQRHGMVNTGKLINSIRYEVRELSNSIELSVGSYGTDYAAINEYGGKVSKRQLSAMFASFRGRAKRAGKGVIKIYPDGSGYHKARPYLRPAAKKHAKFIMDVMRDIYK